MRRPKSKRIETGGWALIGGVLSMLAGALPAASGRDVAAARPARAASARALDGLGIEGDGFYVWDEDDREAEAWAIELAGPAFPRRD